nr:hypothetical protein [Tanacetum cinerariifolium]
MLLLLSNEEQKHPYVGGWAEVEPAGDDGEVVWWAGEDCDNGYVVGGWSGTRGDDGDGLEKQVSLYNHGPNDQSSYSWCTLVHRPIVVIIALGTYRFGSFIRLLISWPSSLDVQHE